MILDLCIANAFGVILSGMVGEAVGCGLDLLLANGVQISSGALVSATINDRGNFPI